MPLFHIAGVNVGLIGLCEGCKVTVLPEVDPAEILRLIEDEKVNLLFMVPAVILFVMQQPDIATRDTQRAGDLRRVTDCRRIIGAGGGQI